MAHGTPLATGDGENNYGVAGPFLLEVGISSSYRIAQFWGLAEHALAPKQAQKTIKPVQPQKVFAEAPDASARKKQTASAVPDIGAVITKALKAAGLMN
jgi:hypothetical protein